LASPADCTTNPSPARSTACAAVRCQKPGSWGNTLWHKNTSRARVCRRTILLIAHQAGAQNGTHQGRMTPSGADLAICWAVALQVTGLSGSSAYVQSTRSGSRLGSRSLRPGNSHRGYCRKNDRKSTSCRADKCFTSSVVWCAMPPRNGCVGPTTASLIVPPSARASSCRLPHEPHRAAFRTSLIVPCGAW